MENIQQEVSALQNAPSGNPDIQNLQDQINDLTNNLEELRDILNAAQDTLDSHQHTGTDASSQMEGGPDLKAATLQLSGGKRIGISEGITALSIYDTTNDIGHGLRGVGMQVGVLGDKDTEGEQDEGIISVGKNSALPPDPLDFSKYNLAEVSILHEPQDTGNPAALVPPAAFFQGMRTPYYISPPLIGSGLITQGGTLLTDNTVTFLDSPFCSLVGCRINLYGLSGNLLEGHVVVANTSNTISINGPWISPSGKYQYEVYTPMYLGQSEIPWRRLYVDNEGGLAIRFGQGPTAGTQNTGIYYGSSIPTMAANPGSIYINMAGGAGTSLYVNETGGAGGWVAYGAGGSSTVKSGEADILMTAASGIQPIAHGLGKIPSFLRVNGCSSNGTLTTVTMGTYDGTNSQCASTTSNNPAWGSGKIVWFSDGTNQYYAVPTFDATYIYLDWTKVNAGFSVSLHFIWEVQ